MTTSSATSLLDTDFTNSYLYWWMNTVNHTPRCAIRARCIVEQKWDFEAFYLSHPCAGGGMYVDTSIIHQPTSEFHLIYNESQEILTVKFFDDAQDCNRTVVRMGVLFPSMVNQGCKITKFEKRLRAFKSVRPLTSDKEVDDAMMGNAPILGRTQFAIGDATVTAEYPVTVMNAHHETHRWQVDTGQILLPDPRIDEKLGIASMREAYIVYNRFDFAEYVLRTPVKNRKGDATIHYGLPEKIRCENVLFAADEI